MVRLRRDLACLVVVAACHKHDEPAPAEHHVVAATSGAIKIDGELSEPDWNRIGDPQTFVDGGREARPYSQVRFLHDADNLYVGLYAADQDIRSSDKFELTVGAVTLAVDPLAHITPAIPGVRAARDLDGTIDQPSDEDEEWVIEMSIPLSAIELRNDRTVMTRTSRCDTPKDHVERCGSWTATLSW
jgi:hypothetical protein